LPSYFTDAELHGDRISIASIGLYLSRRSQGVSKAFPAARALRTAADKAYSIRRRDRERVPKNREFGTPNRRSPRFPQLIARLMFSFRRRVSSP
jgi:hypothetical protein